MIRSFALSKARNRRLRMLLVLSAAAVWAMARFARGRGDWMKTAHHGSHLGPVAEPELARAA